MIVVVPDPLCDIVYYSLYRSLNSLGVRRLCSSIRQTKSADDISQYDLSLLHKQALLLLLLRRLTKEFPSGLMRIRTDAFQIIQFILSFIHDDASSGKRRSPFSILSSQLALIDPDEIELTLRDCSKYVLQRLCHECHYKFRLHKDNQKPRIPILTALRVSFDQLLVLLDQTHNAEKRDLINDLCFNVALYHGNDIMLKYLQYVFTNQTSVSNRSEGESSTTIWSVFRSIFCTIFTSSSIIIIRILCTTHSIWSLKRTIQAESRLVLGTCFT